MPAEEISAFVRQLEDAFNRHDASIYDAHPGLTPSKGFYQGLWAAFPDMRATAQTTIADGAWVGQILSVSGTMQGAFMGMPATGKRAEYEVITMFRVEGGKIVAYHAQADVMGMMQQLGLAPAGGPQQR